MEQELMETKVNTYVEQFKMLDEKISRLSSISGLLDWDQKVIAPKKSRQFFSKAVGELETEIFKLMVSEEMGDLLEVLARHEVLNTLDQNTKARVRIHKAFYEKNKQIPAEVYKEYAILTSEANGAWETAREENNYASYLPYLEKMIQFKRQFAEYMGYEKHPYDALLDEYEPGLTVEKLDQVFAELREATILLLEKIKKSPNKPSKEIFLKAYDVEKQKQFNRFMLPLLGFDLEAGRLDETVHPFAQSVNVGDVRITTRYLEENVLSALFGTIHEAGHGIYEQRINPELDGTVLSQGASYGIHESQSRFLENMVGRSKEFWEYFLPHLQNYFPEHLKDVSVEDFYKAVNVVEPSFIRVEADELTYNLHIIIRYEIEKALIEGKLEAKDLPKVWNEKMEKYLGIIPDTDRDGVLQDIHWSFGAFGYFPSYTLGNLYAAQILKKLGSTLPSMYEHVKEGNIEGLLEWLSENIHQYGSIYTPDELIEKVTGEELNASYLIEYLEEKYTAVYGL